MSAPFQKTEARRLKVLWQYEVLDTVPEEVFDNLTELAARICEAPIALISLVDENRQWFKAKVGFSLSETAREESFCSHAIRQSGLFIVPDALKDPRFAESPFVVSEPHIRFYAGAPLITTDGYALGTLCVIDKVPRTLRPDQKQALTILARHIVSQLELRQRTKELAKTREADQEHVQRIKRLESELAGARRKLARLEDRPASKPAAKKKQIKRG